MLLLFSKLRPVQKMNWCASVALIYRLRFENNFLVRAAWIFSTRQVFMKKNKLENSWNSQKNLKCLVISQIMFGYDSFFSALLYFVELSFFKNHHPKSSRHCSISLVLRTSLAFISSFKWFSTPKKKETQKKNCVVQRQNRRQTSKQRLEGKRSVQMKRMTLVWEKALNQSPCIRKTLKLNISSVHKKTAYKKLS